jgi:hypothetical protein
MANNINEIYPGKVKGYAMPFQNSTSCTYAAGWVVNNNLPLYQALDSGAMQVAYYGGFGMPTVVLLGGASHAKLWSTQDFVTADTTTMKNLILGLLTADLEDEKNVINKLTAYPNPSSEILNVSFNSQNEGEVSLQLLDLSGKEVLNISNEKISTGIVEKHLSVVNIANGTYILSISLNGFKTQQKISVLH